MPLVKLPGMISLGGGMPNPITFPFKSLSFQLNDGHELTLSGSELVEGLQYSNTVLFKSLKIPELYS
jgi:kynurenine/2-aminoadipate aminotransferase